MKAKIALFCNVAEEAVITAKDVDSDLRSAAGVRRRKEWTRRSLRLPDTWRQDRELSHWRSMVRPRAQPEAAKCASASSASTSSYEDSYKSLKRSAAPRRARAQSAHGTSNWIEAEDLDSAGRLRSGKLDALRRHPGAGRIRQARHRGHAHAIRYARESKVPYFGICLGMQTACDRICAQCVRTRRTPTPREFDPQTPHRVIYKLRELRGVDELGGTMRLGAWPCKIEPGTLAYAGLWPAGNQRAPSPSLRIQPRVSKRLLTAAGLRIIGRDSGWHLRRDGASLPDHPWFLGCQFHPEFKSKPLEPHPLFAAFVGAAQRFVKARTRPTDGPAVAAAAVLGSRKADGSRHCAEQVLIPETRITASALQIVRRRA